ncbi:MAG: 1-acyl-sn-glycerol-3-phosphate acyltransferase [Rhodobacteraceae bacterium]|nr:1-acyl-sn-glycerol-3-phosphate acyltransferase [Paracoccaceae bacterium]
MKDAVQWVRSLIYVVQVYLMMPVIGLLFAPWAIFSKKGTQICCKTYSRWAFWTARWIVGVKTEVRGTPPSGNVLIAAKHQSFLDVLMLYEALPAAKFIVKREIFWTPVIGQYAKMMGCVAVDRGKRGAAIKQMLEGVKNGAQQAGQLIIYSQGTRILPGVKAPYKVGVGVLYEELGQPCVPVAINVGMMWPRHGIMQHPGVAVIEFLEPIEPGLPRNEFMGTLEQVVEEKSNALMREAGFDPDKLW